VPQPEDPLDDYAQYERQFDPLLIARRARRQRKPRLTHQIKVTQRELASGLADPTAIEAGFDITYQPGRFEAPWLRGSIEPFFEDGLITDVLSQVKGGKEASVYLCAAAPATGVELLAAKVYRPRQFRNLRNDKVYRDGREVLLASGGQVKKSDHREMRAIGKKTAFGLELAHTSWLMYEFQTLERLYQAGGAVPRPWSTSGNAILMEYLGDRQMAAPTLNQVRLTTAQAQPLFREVLRNIDLLLQHELIHGDLSAYNLLYWQDRLTLIDFPQAINIHVNRQAYPILRRDVQRICEYFCSQGVPSDPQAILEQLWERYTGRREPLPVDPALAYDLEQELASD
jgi:RIO kinase 1